MKFCVLTILCLTILPVIYAQQDKENLLFLKGGGGLYSDINGLSMAKYYGGFFNHGPGIFIEAETFKRKRHSYSLSLDGAVFRGINQSLPGLTEYYRGEVITPAILYNRYFKIGTQQHLIASTGIAIEFFNYNLLYTDPHSTIETFPGTGFDGTGGLPLVIKYEYTGKRKWNFGGRLQTYYLIGLPFPSVSVMPYVRYNFKKNKIMHLKR
jgi:hypothetical protein